MKTPFTILSGWLGAGKTTALNRMLAAANGRRIAVLVNELGRISIDTQLIVGAGGDVLELAGGCVCCKVDIKNDLWEGITEIVERSKPDHVVLETTGIAEPAAILESLHAQAARGADSIAAKRAAEQAAARERIQPAGVICVVDAESGASALDEREEAAAQVMAADRVLISKLDVASPEAVVATHEKLDRLAAHAERAAFPTDKSVEMTSWLLEQRTVRAWNDGHDHEHHEHHPQLIAVAFADDSPLVAARVMAVIDGLGAKLVRAKGFVNVAGEAKKGFVERAGIRTSFELRDEWDGDRKTELVLIGDDLDEAAIRRALWACRAGT
ncbi:MAG: GTP-binding protein [Kofleriaceae bacterium]